MKAVSLPLGIGCLPNPSPPTVYISPVPEYILGVDVLYSLSLQTSRRRVPTPNSSGQSSAAWACSPSSSSVATAPTSGDSVTVSPARGA